MSEPQSDNHDSAAAEPDTNSSTAPQTGEPRDWAVSAAAAADDKLGTEIVVVDVGDVLSITGYFVICSGGTGRQVRAIAEEVERQLKLTWGMQPLRREGFDGLEWVLLDYGDFVVHAMHHDAREYYQLERLWADQPTVDWKALSGTPG